MVHCGMFTKWKINIVGLELYRVLDNGDIYRLPISKGLRNYDFRLIKMQYPNRWRMNGQWYSKNQIRTKLILDPDPIEVFKIKDLPF